MFWNNVKIALRNLRKNKAFAAINILGLAIGLTIFVFGGLLVEYESTHDAFFKNASNTYTIGSHAAPDLDVGVDVLNATFSAVLPIVEVELSDVEAVARTVAREFLVRMGEESFYENISFADPAFLEIFDFEFPDDRWVNMSATEVLEYIGYTRPTNPLCRECGGILREYISPPKKIRGIMKWKVPLDAKNPISIFPKHTR